MKTSSNDGNFMEYVMKRNALILRWRKHTSFIVSVYHKLSSIFESVIMIIFNILFMYNVWFETFGTTEMLVQIKCSEKEIKIDPF